MGFFKAYDMRGTFGKDFTADTVRAVGEALPGVVGAKKFLVGRDMRLTSRTVRDALVAGLLSAGAEVDDIGPATTPMVYFFTADGDCGASVQITASHNPAGDNGMKVSFGDAMPVGYANGIGELEKIAGARLASGRPVPPFADVPALFPAPEEPDAARLARYVEWMRERLSPDAAKVKFAVDCSNGMASLFARTLFGGAAVRLNDVPDGSFPAHSPNPLAAEARAQISAAVREQGLDLGLIFDGDADRVMAVDRDGDFVQPDFLIPAVASTYLRAEPGAPVLHDVRTSRAAIEALRAAGARPVMGKVGHAFAKPLMRKTGAPCGGELAGHYYFREFACCDSGALAAVRLLNFAAEAREAGSSFTDRIRPLVSKYANSGELNFTVADKPAAIGRALKAAESIGREVSRSDIDGFRIEYEEGWVSIRQSNTEPYLRLIIETDGAERLAAWKAALSAAVAAA